MSPKGPTSSPLDQAVAAATTATEALAALHAAEGELRAQYAAAVEARRQLLEALPPKAEVLATLRTLIQQTAAAEVAQLGRSLIGALGRGLALQADGALVPRPSAWPDYFYLGGSIDTVYKLIGLFPELAERTFTAAIDAVAYTPGSPAADRPRLVAEADAVMAELERQHTALVDKAGETGMRLEPLPHVAERRAAKARADREAEEAEARRKAAAPLDSRTGRQRVAPDLKAGSPRYGAG